MKKPLPGARLLYISITASQLAVGYAVRGGRKEKGESGGGGERKRRKIFYEQKLSQPEITNRIIKSLDTTTSRRCPEFKLKEDHNAIVQTAAT